MLELLTDRPVIGIASGLGSGGLFTLNDFILNESVLKIVAGYGVWIGALVAILTLILKLLEIVEKIIKKK